MDFFQLARWLNGDRRLRGRLTDAAGFQHEIEPAEYCALPDELLDVTKIEVVPVNEEGVVLQ